MALTPDPSHTFVHTRSTRPFFGQAASANLAAALFVVVLPLVAHWQFSRLGFNPTDDGFVLAVSRRMLAGELPHRDFIAIHPIGSSILHLPFVWLGGDRVFLASRLFVWFELAATALVWTQAIERLIGKPRAWPTELAIAVVAFVLSSHYFPVMAWPTIDGLLLAGLGVRLCLARPRTAHSIGYFLIGAAFICKQSYLPLYPVTVVLLHQGRGLRWVAGLIPALAYATVVAVGGGLGDAVLQLSAQTGIISVGVLKFLWEYAVPWGVLAGYLALRVIYAPDRTARGRLDCAAAGLLIFSTLSAACWALAQGRFLGAPAFGLFGLAVGACIACAFETDAVRGRWVAGVLVVTAAWCAALSIGYNTPALASGLCAAYVLSLVDASPATAAFTRGVWRTLPYLVLAAGAAICFRDARDHYVYLDRSASELTYKLDDVLPGGAGLLTNENTYAFLADLRQAIDKAGGGKYAVLPDLAGYWVEAAQLNPLPSDWPNWIELARPELASRFLRAMDSDRPNLTFIVQKIDAFSLSRGFVPMLDSERYAVASYVRRNYTLVGETRFFGLYR